MRLMKQGACALYLLVTAVPAFAQGVPTVDATAIAQQLQELEVARQALQNGLAQLDNLQAQLETMSGLSDLSLDLPSLEFELPTVDLSSIANDFISGGNAPGFDEIRSIFNFDDLDLMAGSDSATMQTHVEMVGRFAANFSYAEQAIESAQGMVERADDLADGAGSVSSLKEAVDYGAAVNAEVARNQAQQTALLATLLKQQAISELVAAEDFHKGLLNSSDLSERD